MTMISYVAEVHRSIILHYRIIKLCILLTLAVIADPANIPCSELHIAKISETIVSWEQLSQYFGISHAEQEEIRSNLSCQYLLQKREMLWRWKQKLGNEATYAKLKRIFTSAGNKLLADQVDELLHNPYSQSSHSAMATFKQYLKDCYTLHSQPSSHAGVYMNGHHSLTTPNLSNQGSSYSR